MDKFKIFKINKLFDSALAWFVSIKLCFLLENSRIESPKSIGTANVEQLFQIEQLVPHEMQPRDPNGQFYLIASTRRLRAPNSLFGPWNVWFDLLDLGIAAKIFYMAPSRQWPTVDGINKCSFFIYERKWNKIFEKKSSLFFSSIYDGFKSRWIKLFEWRRKWMPSNNW